MIDLTKLWNAMPRDVQRKISIHDLKRTVDAYNAPPDTKGGYSGECRDCTNLEHCGSEHCMAPRPKARKKAARWADGPPDYRCAGW